MLRAGSPPIRTMPPRFLLPHLPSRRLLSFSIVVVLTFAACWAQAQEQARPRIGLVLAGGGAKGVAHIGVLKVLDELNVPVDYVVGTSMGSILAGAYASGLTGAELERRVRAAERVCAPVEHPADRHPAAPRRRGEIRCAAGGTGGGPPRRLGFPDARRVFECVDQGGPR